MPYRTYDTRKRLGTRGKSGAVFTYIRETFVASNMFIATGRAARSRLIQADDARHHTRVASRPSQRNWLSFKPHNSYLLCLFFAPRYTRSYAQLAYTGHKDAIIKLITVVGKEIKGEGRCTAALELPRRLE